MLGFKFVSIDLFMAIPVSIALKDGIFELKIDFGPGYRVYYIERDGALIILLAGGDKASQQKDLRLATALAKNL